MKRNNETIIELENGSRIAVAADGFVGWTRESGALPHHDSGIRIPALDSIRDFQGTAEALRELAEYVESIEP